MDFMKVMHTRQTTRSFQKFALSQGQVELMLQAGQNAPISRGRFEDYHITVIKNPEILAAITYVSIFSMQSSETLRVLPI